MNLLKIRYFSLIIKVKPDELKSISAGALYDSAAVSSAVKQKIGDDNKAYIRVLLPESGQKTLTLIQNFFPS